jgi:hypothetical protein
MPDCPACGAPVQIATVEGEGKVALNTIAEPKGPHRYRLVGDQPGTAEAVSENVEVYAYPDHRRTCSAIQRGSGVRR